MSYRVGQKVVCVNDDFLQLAADPNFTRVFKQLPKRDVTYTIREYDAPSMKLEEIQNDEVLMDLGGLSIKEEPGFHQNRFAPLQENVEEMTESTSVGIEEEVLEHI